MNESWCETSVFFHVSSAAWADGAGLSPPAHKVFLERGDPGCVFVELLGGEGGAGSDCQIKRGLRFSDEFLGSLKGHPRKHTSLRVRVTPATSLANLQNRTNLGLPPRSQAVYHYTK